MKHLVSITDANIPQLLSSAHCIENTFINYKFNKILTNLFYEPSTRTSSSFASAMYKLGGKVISINDVPIVLIVSSKFSPLATEL